MVYDYFFRFNEKSLSRILFWGTLAIHVISSAFFYFGILRIPGAATDHATYITYGTQIAALLKTHTYTLGAVYPYNWFPLYVGSIFFLFGTPVGSLIVVIGNSILISFSAVFLFKIFKASGAANNYAFIGTFLVMNLYESLIIYTGLILKESWIIFLLISGIYVSVTAIQKKNFFILRILYVIMAFLALRNLRYFMGFALIASFFALWFSGTRYSLKQRLIRGGILIVVVTLLTHLLTGNTIGKGMSIYEYVRPSVIQQTRSSYFRGGATTTNIEIAEPHETSSGTTYVFSPHGIILSSTNALLGPFPWQIAFHKYLSVILDMALWYAVVFFGVVGLFRLRNRVAITLLVPLGIIGGALAFGVDNLGALLRYRVPFLVLAVIIAGVGATAVFSKQSYTTS